MCDSENVCSLPSKGVVLHPIFANTPRRPKGIINTLAFEIAL